MKELTVLRTSNQHAILTATFYGNPSEDTLIFEYILKGVNEQSWGFNYKQVSVILAGQSVAVRDCSIYNWAGTFDISNYKNWLYNLELFSSAEELRKEILGLLNYSLYGSQLSKEV
ncbi:hypothetical protein [Vibrio anguillarum]|uniref:Uncharacterized protein n=5 Tax=Vibrio anguillarum TaxID=55601 RepID=A0A8I0RUL0_VIBAN|nr:hypothetical protein [Vibrio anguillarum]AVT66112.1 hypothetical protein B5S57_02690 [Vibrio anguillarum]MBF4216392.1 hypothetical protein [Vibrio anguillarum]MBF4220245.1 hypothetical protein [Vibrio anguillarum]MBF4226814.1 hypothetical protein [Vibrio anguillarum]MBF4231454.1 hypothetical protein [Vibrio anguillarum]